MVRARFPWGEVGALSALYVALLAWSGRATGSGLAGFAVLVAALLVAVVPRLVARRVGAASPMAPTSISASHGVVDVGLGWQGERALRVACAAGSIAIASLVHGGGHEPAVVHTLRMAGLVVAMGALGWLASALHDAAVPQSRSLAKSLGDAVLRTLPAAVVAAGAYSNAPLWIALGCVALVVRVARLRSQVGDPFARARFTWLAGSLGALSLGAVYAGLRLGVSVASARAMLPVALAGLACALFGALASAGAAAASAARVVRGAALATLGVSAGALLARASGDVVFAAWTGAAFALAGAALGSSAALVPSIARFVRAVDRAAAAAAGAERVDDVAAAVLAPIREAAGDLQAPVALWLPDEGARVVLDVAGAARSTPNGTEADRALVTYLRARGGPVLSVAALRPLAVRRPELRAVLEALEAHGASVAVALSEPEAGGLAAVLLLPVPSTRRPLDVREALALERLALRTSRALAMARALERARSRANEAERAHAGAEQARAAVEQRLASVSAALSRTMRAPGTLRESWVGYAEASRALERVLGRVADAFDPMLLCAEPGVSVAAVASKLHAMSPRAARALVLVDASSVHPRDLERVLCGDGIVPGWIDAARGGTLLIEQAHVLTSDVARAVVRAATEPDREAHVRLVLAAPGPLREMHGAPELCALLDAREPIELPPLRAREEDLEPLALLALDRACRVHARAPLGFSREALAALRSYAWPGNERELFDVLERAAAKARGDRVVLDDLPAAVVASAPAGVNGDTRGRTSVSPVGEDAATYEALERRILETALERTGGNKSEAARSLGLARTTFLDKLRKFGLRE